jgi:tetratricopeptide (TPR) repeat protein/DNA-binding winged helix-turn-helix (wHTH) protein
VIANEIELVDAVVDLKGRRLVRDPVVTRLTAREIEVLCYLRARAGRVVSQEALEREVWEFVPGVRSEAVRVALTRLRSKIELDPKKPRSLHQVRGRGWCLEVTPPGIIGRSRLLEQLHERLDAGPATILLKGPGGIGKTRLAVKLAAERNGRVCDLSDARDCDGALAAVALGLGIELDRDDAAPGQVRAASEHVSMVVLDGVEHLDDALLTALVAELQCPVLLAARRAPAIPGDTVVVGPLTKEQAALLFHQCAEAASPGFEAEPGLVEQIVDSLGGIPVAIELTAARMTVMSAAQLAERVSAPEPVQEAVRWALNHLGALAAENLRKLAALEGRFDVEAAEAVVATRVLQATLEELVGAGLVREVEPIDGNRWYRIPSIIRQSLGPVEPQIDAWRSIALRGDRVRHLVLEQGVLLATLAALEPDLRAALTKLVSVNAGNDAARAALALATLYDLRGPNQRGIEALDRLHDIEVDPGIRASLLTMRARTLRRSRISSAPMAAEAVALARAIGAEDHVFEAELTLGLCYSLAGQHADGQRVLETALASPAGQRVSTNAARAWGYLSMCQAPVGQYREAEESLGIAIDLLDELGHGALLGWAWWLLGTALAPQGRFEEALDAADRAIACLEQGGQHLRRAAAIADRGAYLQLLGRYDEAAAALEEAREACLAQGQRGEAANATLNLAQVYRDQGDLERCTDLLGEAGRMLRRTGHHTGAAVAQANLAFLLQIRGEPEQARGAWARAMEQLQAISQTQIRGHFRSLHSAFLASSGATAEAGHQLERAEAELAGTDTAESRGALDVARAWISFRCGEDARALALLEPVERGGQGDAVFAARLLREAMNAWATSSTTCSTASPLASSSTTE